MRYWLTERNSDDPAGITIPEGYEGFGCLIRSRDLPVGFIISKAPPGSILSPTQVARLIARSGAFDFACSVTETALPRTSLTIAVCTRNRPLMLRKNLSALASLNQPPGLFLQLLVVDNAPPDDASRSAVAAYPSVRYVVEPVPGLNFARNRVLAEVNTDWVAFIDDDAIVDRRWIDGFLIALSINPDAGAVCGPVLPAELETEAQVLFEHRGGFGRTFRRARYDLTKRIAVTYPGGAGLFGAGCNMVFRREFLRAIGGFDEGLDTAPPHVGGGDLDAFYRLIRSGHVLVREPHMVVFHHHRREMAQLRHQMWTWGVGFMAYVSKSYTYDQEERWRLALLVLWWFYRKLGKLLLWCLRLEKRPWRLDLLLFELAGGVYSLTGEYRRSVRRSDRLRSTYLGLTREKRAG